jgi:putative hydrolase of the HAD superfamily
MDECRAVLFDFFGTLTRAMTRGPRHAAIARALGADPDEFIAALDRSFHARARGSYGSPEMTLRRLCHQVGMDPPAYRLRAAVRARVRAVRADTHLRPDAVATLAAIRGRGLRTAVVSDCGYELPRFLPLLPVAPLLDARVYSVDIGECKPDPAMYEAACDRLGVHPSECLFVGDGGSRELTGAAAVGMRVVRLAAADLDRHLVYAPDREFAGPEIGSLAETLRLLGGAPAAAYRPVRPLPRRQPSLVARRRAMVGLR